MDRKTTLILEVSQSSRNVKQYFGQRLDVFGRRETIFYLMIKRLIPLTWLMELSVILGLGSSLR